MFHQFAAGQDQEIFFTFWHMPICDKEMGWGGINDTRQIIMECNKLERIRKKAFQSIIGLNNNFKIWKIGTYTIKIYQALENTNIIEIISSFIKCISQQIVQQ